MKSQRIERLLALIQTLESGRSLTAEELAGIVKVSRRTVFRDLELLKRSGIEYCFDYKSKRYSTRPSTLLPPVTLSHAETLTLLLAARQISESAVLPDKDAATSAAIKLESMLPAAVRDYCGPIAQLMVIRPEPVSDTEAIRDTLAGLQTAVAQHQRISVRYDSYYEGKELVLLLRPYRLTHIRRGWYLIAAEDKSLEVRTYKLERMLGLRVLDSTFDPDPKFSLEEYFGNAWQMIRGEERYHVKIRFLPMVGANVDEVQWHKTQRTSYQSDGSLIFEADVDGIKEISWWILGYGDQAQVLEPQCLRDLMSEHAQRMHEYYIGTATSLPIGPSNDK